MRWHPQRGQHGEPGESEEPKGEKRKEIDVPRMRGKQKGKRAISPIECSISIFFSPRPTLTDGG
jgi:hypothetical protein